jgi:hypothetical protein
MGLYIPFVSVSAGEPIAMTAADFVMQSKPPDDAGATTADNFDWQAAMAAADGLALYLQALDDDGNLGSSEDCSIICEHQEDWVTIQSETAELVSAKHREPPYGIFTTLSQLVDAGGVGHLFNRWHTLAEHPTCRLVTSAALGPDEPRGLELAMTTLAEQRLAGNNLQLDRTGQQLVATLVRALQRHPDRLPQGWLADDALGAVTTATLQIFRFLSMLSIDHSKPGRAYVGHAAPSLYAQPILNRVGRPAVPASAIWEAVHGLFRVRMRAAGPTPWAGLPIAMSNRDHAHARAIIQHERSLAARTVTLADIDLAVRTAIAAPGGFMPLKRISLTSRVAIKMAAGHCTDNSIERAELLRIDYRNYWRSKRVIDPAARIEEARMCRHLLQISDIATSAISRHGGPQGPAFWAELQSKIATVSPGTWPNGLDNDTILGGICEQANLCRVWFGDRFDIDATVSEIHAQRDLRS